MRRSQMIGRFMPCFGAGTRPFSGTLRLYRVSVRYRVRPQCCELDQSRDQGSKVNGSHQVLRCRKRCTPPPSSGAGQESGIIFTHLFGLTGRTKNRDSWVSLSCIRACVDFLLTPLSGPVAEISNDQRGVPKHISDATSSTPVGGRSNALMIIL